MGVLVPIEYGGSGFSYNEYVTAIEELAILDPSIGLSMAAHNSLCTGHILQLGFFGLQIKAPISINA